MLVNQLEEGWRYRQPINLQDWSYFGHDPLDSSWVRPLQGVLTMPSRRNFSPFTPLLIIIISGNYHTITPNLGTSGSWFPTRYPYTSIYKTRHPAAVRICLSLHAFLFLIAPSHSFLTITPLLSIHWSCKHAQFSQKFGQVTRGSHESFNVLKTWHENFETACLEDLTKYAPGKFLVIVESQGLGLPG